MVGMLVNLYAVRVVLAVLGAEDYGVYNVVGGVVVLFTFLSGAATGATQRFLNFALGRGDMGQARDVYCAGLVIHALIAAALVVLAQTAGLWFFRAWLNIPEERKSAAFAVYQISVALMAIGVLQAPYRATVVAHERMSFFAALSLIEAALKLGSVLALRAVAFDKLVAYAFLVCASGVVVLATLKFYCNAKFEIARFRRCGYGELVRRLLGFSIWSVFGGAANAGREQGTNILVNIFHGVSVNAAMGIAAQVNAAIYQFVGNFQTAFNPQIVKSYSAGESERFMRLVFRTSKLSFCLLFLFVLPLFANADFALGAWLGEAPEHTVAFTRALLLSALVMAIYGPLWMSVQATGDIKKYQLVVSCFAFANLPLSYLFLRLGFGPVRILIARFGLDVAVLVWLVFFLGGRIGLPVAGYFREVVARILVASGISTLAILVAGKFIGDDWKGLVTSAVVSTAAVASLTYWVVLDSHERASLLKMVKGRVGNSRKNL
jgi:O-antigen/teichoic acid export membrane protein